VLTAAMLALLIYAIVDFRTAEKPRQTVTTVTATPTTQAPTTESPTTESPTTTTPSPAPTAVQPPRPSTRLSQITDQIGRIATSRSTEARKLGVLVRGELDWIVMKALEKDRQRRYETPSSLGLDIEHYLRGEPITAAPPSRRYRATKFFRRHL
jgi:hypothetical protein